MRRLSSIMLLVAFIGSCFQTLAQSPAPVLVPNNSYAFQWTGDSDIGLYFNSSDALYEFRDLNANVPFSWNALNGRAYIQSRLGIGVSNPSTALQVVGESRFGNVSNRATIGSNGDLTFQGTANYLVGNNDYAFKYSGGNQGLFFNTSNLRYEFLNGIGDRIFSVNVEGGADGDVWAKGNMNIDGNVVSSDSLRAETGHFTSSTWNDASNGGGALRVGPLTGQHLGIDYESMQTYNGEGTFNTFLYLNPYGGNVEIANGPDNDGYVNIQENTLYVDGATNAVGIGVDFITNNKLRVRASDKEDVLYSENTGTILGSALKGEYTNGSYDPSSKAVHGVADATGFSGYGGYFSGGWYGVFGKATTGASFQRYGVRGLAGVTSGTCYGIYGAAEGFGTNYAVYASGDLAYTGSLLDVSDARLKKDVKDLENATELLQTLTPKTYEFKTEEYDYMDLADGKQYGFIAQELEAVMPELVHDMKHPGSADPEYRGEELSFKGVSYIPFIPVLVQAFKEQQSQIEALNETSDAAQQSEIDALKANNEALNAENERINDRLDKMDALLAQLDQSLAACCVYHEEGKAIEGHDHPSLGQNIPNPFTNSTLISYYLPQGSNNAKMMVLDLTGKMVKSYDLEGSGFGQVEFSHSEIAAGTYLYTLILNGKRIDTKQMVLVK